MRLIIQRVTKAEVQIEGKIYSAINAGLLIFAGIEESDSEEDILWLCSKTCNMRIFADSDGKMNLSVKEIGGELLVVSQFTLHASTKKGNRPSFIKAARPEQAIPLYEALILEMEKELGKPVETGEFGADMKISLTNDGPVTIIIDSKSRE